MNKNLLIVAGGVVLVTAIGIGIFIVKPFQKSSPSQPQTSNEARQQEETSSDLQNIKGTLMDLLARSLPLECTFSQDDESIKSTGTIYVAGKKMRGNFESELPNGQTTTFSIIQDEEHRYMWMSNQDQGSKFKIDAFDTEADFDSDQKTETENLTSFEDENLDYACKPWIVDNSFFIPPSGIDFVDLSENIQEMEEASQQVEAAQCSACDQLPAGQGREACRESMGCD